MLETNITSGILSQEKYVADINATITKYKSQAPKSPPRLKAKLLKHIELMESELSEPPPEEEEEDPVPPSQPRPTLTHEELMQKEVYNYCYSELLELKDAFLYLRETGQTAQLEAVMKKAEQCQKVVDRFKAGEEPTHYVAPLLPEDLLGMTEPVRLRSLEQIISQMQASQAAYKDKAIAAIKAGDKATAAQHKGKMQRYEKMANLASELRQNPWQPLPVLVQEEIKLTEQVANEELAENEVCVVLSDATGFPDSDSFYCTGQLALANSQTVSFTSRPVQRVNQHGFKHIEKMTIDPKQIPSLDRRRLTIEVWQHRTLWSDVSMGSFTVKLAELAGKCTVEMKQALSRGGPTLKVVVQVKRALKAQETRTVSVHETVIGSVLPPFKKADGSLFAPSKAAPPQPSQAAPGPSQSAGARAPPPIQEESKSIPSPSSLSPEEIKDPTILSNLNSYEVLEAEKNRLLALIAQAREKGVNPAPYQNKQREVMRKQATIQAQVDNGVITPEAYQKVVSDSIEHDMQLARYFKEKGDAERLKIVVERVKTMKKELAEMAGQG